jgi:WD40 repeat protein
LSPRRPSSVNLSGQEHRNWEWQYLHSQLDGPSVMLPAPGGKYRSHALSPSGHQVAVCGSDDNQEYLYDVATGKEAAVLRGHSARATITPPEPDAYGYEAVEWTPPLPLNR